MGTAEAGPAEPSGEGAGSSTVETSVTNVTSSNGAAGSQHTDNVAGVIPGRHKQTPHVQADGEDGRAAAGPAVDAPSGSHGRSLVHKHI